MKKICVDDASVKLDKDTLMIQREAGFLSLGSCILGGGLSKVRSIMNHTIDKKNQLILQNPKGYLKRIVRDKGILNPAAAMMTAVDIKKSATVTLDYVTAIITAGITNPSTAGDLYGKADAPKVGTINVVVLINENLTHEALVNSFMTATEAKSAALWDLDVRSRFSGDIATGTTSDSMIIACVGEGDTKYAGSATELGMLIGRCTKKAAKKAIKKYGFSKTILDFIENMGVKIEYLVDAGMELCVGVKSEDLYIKLEKEILKALEDINVISFIIAGARLEEDYKKGRINRINVEDDPAFLYADEVIGMAIANQIAGTKAIFNFKRYDEEKPGIIGELGPILDDVFAGLVAGCMSKIFEE